jgi:tRNA-specific 2-thiouridylase
VTKIDAPSRSITVGPRAALERSTLQAGRVNWISGEPPEGEVRVAAQIRHRHTPGPGRLEAVGTDRATLTFDTPQVAVSPGQAVVFYDGDRVLGGGWIE